MNKTTHNHCYSCLASMVVFDKSSCTVLYLFKMFNLGSRVWIPYRRGIVKFWSGLHGPRVRLIIRKTFDDLEAMSVIWFAQVSLVSNFIPRYGWLEIVESGTPQGEYECSLGFVLFVIGRCTHLGMLNSICWTMFVVGSGQIGGCCYLFQIWFCDRWCCHQQRAVLEIECCCLCHLCIAEKELVLGLSLWYSRCNTCIIRQGAVDWNSLFSVRKKWFYQGFWCFQLFHRRQILIGGVYEGLCQRLWRNQAGWHLSVSCYL